ncbi:uncharacterized protein LOC128501405 [Spea bombifrons]|uniref:uncharacterized protein LOC128501405 n=1 Tax=Spea bombifrons TaxID=233779 RepID=UPI0023498378|nr:uncharacterized protein LOC128501405 [Spea bombifrons]
MAHLLSLLLLLPRACAELQISAPTSQAALQGSDVLLNCSFSVDDRHVDPKYLAVLWYFKEKIILTSDSKGKDLSPRISFNERAALAGDASIKLSDVNIEDEGLYRCVVIYAPDKKEKEITLNVLVRPTIQIHNKYVSERSLVCSARGFYPPPIGITWLRDKEVLKNATLDKPLRGPDGAYTTESTLTIADDRGHTNDIFICKVHHESLEEPLQESTLLIYRDKRNAWVTTASILVGLAMVGAVVGFLLWKQRLQKKASGRFSLNDIQGPEKLVDGEEVVLICTATNCPGTPRVTWFEKGKVGPLEILEPPDSGPGESEQPLTRTYAIRKKAEGFGDYTTSLRFRFCFQKHNRLSFICRFTSDKVFKEKTFHCTSVYAKPQLAEPIKASLCISGEVVCSISLQNFYPQQIKIGWKCERGDLPAKLSSKEKFQTNPDFTVNVCSKVRIPGDFFRDPEGKLSVTWEHECLAAPGSCALSARSPGYPWNPVVEEIKTPLLFHGIPVKLECKISNYFPDALTANWLIKNNGSPEELPVPDKENVLVTKSQNKEDFTHSCTSSLTVTPTLGAHQGAEYVCRVSHPSLETPIERRTEKLRILAKPCRKEPIKATLMDSSRIYFSLYLQNFYPRDIKVTWYNDRKTCKSLLPSNEILTQSEDLTSNVNSWVETLGTIFEDPQDKVTVTWKHASLGVTDSISLCVRGRRHSDP